jgi:hypothetical protein
MLQTQTTPTTEYLSKIRDLENTISELKFQLQLENMKATHEEFMHQEYKKLYLDFKEHFKNKL